MTLQCPRCRVTLELEGEQLRAVPRPFRNATPESVAGPPDVRVPPKHPSSRTVTCAHCKNDFHPARGTRNPRFCGRSCARRHALARKHSFA